MSTYRRCRLLKAWPLRDMRLPSAIGGAHQLRCTDVPLHAILVLSTIPDSKGYVMPPPVPPTSSGPLRLLALYSGLLLSFVTIIIALIFPIKFFAAPRAVTYLLVAFLPAIAFENAASQFRIMSDHPGFKFALSTVGSAALLFGTLFIVDALFSEPSTPQPIIAEIIDEKCSVVDLPGEASLSFYPPANLYASYLTDNKAVVIVHPNTTLTAVFSRGPGGLEYSGAIGHAENIDQSWKLGVDLITPKGDAKCVE